MSDSGYLKEWLYVVVEVINILHHKKIFHIYSNKSLHVVYL